MTHLPKALRVFSLAAVAATVALSSCSSGNNPGKAPRVDAIPAQEATGGVPFTLNLTNFVSGPNNATVGYTVTSGGGSVNGTGVYSHTFNKVGDNTVSIQADDGVGQTPFTFTVTVKSAQLAVIQAGSGLVLLDRGTIENFTSMDSGALYSDHFLVVSNSQGYTDTFKTNLTRGHVVYERNAGGQLDLYVFNPQNRSTTRLGDDSQNTTDEKFQARTSDNRVVFTSGSSTDPNLYIWNHGTGLTREISAQENVAETNARVDANNIVYFEAGPTAQRDIYAYDPSEDSLETVSNNAANEIIQAVIRGGGVVFSRNNGAGDIDLWFYREDIGLTQVAADVSTAGFQDGTLTYNGDTSTGLVVFTHAASGTDNDLYYWNPANQTTTVVAANAAVHDTFNGVTWNDKIVYTHEVGGGHHDIHIKVPGGADTDISAAASADVFAGITSQSDIVFVRGGNDLRVWDDSASTLLNPDSGAAITVDGFTPGSGNVVFTKAGTGLRRYEVAGAVATVSATGVYRGSINGGDNIVYSQDVGGQDDLYRWDEVADGSATITDSSSDDVFVSSGTGSTEVVIFSRKLTGGTTYDLWVWEAVAGARKISDTTLTHTGVTTYYMDNR